MGSGAHKPVRELDVELAVQNQTAHTVDDKHGVRHREGVIRPKFAETAYTVFYGLLRVISTVISTFAKCNKSIGTNSYAKYYRSAKTVAASAPTYSSWTGGNWSTLSTNPTSTVL